MSDINHNKLPIAYISFGGNINPEQHIKNALLRMKQDFSGFECSSVYESKAVGFEGGDFLNLVVKVDSHFSVGELNEYLHDIEALEGRERLNGKAWDSRTLDLDILLYEDQVGCIDGVDLPRGEILEHAHVLIPLAEIASEITHPLSGRTFLDLLQETTFENQEIHKIKFEIFG